MPENVRTNEPPSMASLVGGIVNDAERLVRQEITLARRELQLELDKAKTAAVNLVGGMSVTAVGTLFLGFMLVYLLYWLTNEGWNQSEFPLWACFGIVGALLAAVGGVMLYLGAQKVAEVSLVPPETAKTLEENVQWLQNQTK
jgi:hypothetical protein